MLATSLAGDLGAALDPVLFARRTGLEPDPWQAEVLRSGSREIILNCSRQVGKSTITSVLAAHTALYAPGALTLILSPSERQSVELLRKVKAALAALGTAATEVEKDNALSREFANGSRILALPGKEGTIRGFSGVRLLIIDEAARVPCALYQAVRPMLAVSGGRIVLLSTPFGKRGFFHREWAEGGAAWERIRITARECPRIDPAFIAEERRALGFWFPQEYECAFLDTVNALFAGEDIDRAFANDVPPLFPLDQ